MYLEFNRPAELQSDKVIIIPKGSGLNEIAILLSDNGVIKSKINDKNTIDILVLKEKISLGFSEDAVSYTHLTLPTNREV